MYTFIKIFNFNFIFIINFIIISFIKTSVIFIFINCITIILKLFIIIRFR